MFERLVVRKQNPTDVPNPIDLGFLAEAMLFYGDVALVTNRFVMQQLLRRAGPILLQLLPHEPHQIGGHNAPVFHEEGRQLLVLGDVFFSHSNESIWLRAYQVGR